MARWSGRIGLTHKLGIAAAGAINGSVLANPIPGARQLQEQLALVAYARVAMPPLLSLAEPRVGSLLDTVVPPSTGGAWEAEMDELVEYLVRAYRERISQLEWMTPETRERALEKLGKFKAKIGYPDTEDKGSTDKVKSKEN